MELPLISNNEKKIFTALKLNTILTPFLSISPSSLFSHNLLATMPQTFKISTWNDVDVVGIVRYLLCLKMAQLFVLVSKPERRLCA